MATKIKCPLNLYVPTGMLGSLSAKDTSLTTVFPAIKHKVYVSFNVDDCKKMNMDVLHEEILDQAIELIDSSSSKPDTKKNLSFKEKKLKVYNEGEHYTFNGYLKHLKAYDIQYFKHLFLTLNCLTNLEFEIVDKNLYDKDTSEYKVSICGTKNHILRDN